MAKTASCPGKPVRIKGGVTLYVEEYSHAYLVRGPGIKWGPTAQQAKLALFEYLGRKKWTRINAMPYRPLFTGEMGDKNPCGAVAFYFNIGPACDCHKQDNRYKP